MEFAGGGKAKLNVDGAFMLDSRAGVSMILRDHKGEVIIAACKQLHQCEDELEVELAAMEEGLGLAQHWTTDSIVLKSDYAEGIKIIYTGSPNLSRYATRVEAISETSRDANGASHILTQVGRV